MIASIYMKNLITLTLILSLCISLQAQVINDDCSGTINLGTAPVCMETVYSNSEATPSDIGDNNVPECFVDGPNQDVWFSFISDSEITSYSIVIEANDENGNPIKNIQAAVYRGFCPDNIFALLTCATGEPDEDNLTFQVSDLTPNDLYFIRVDNFGGAGFAGDFTICVNESDTEYVMDGSTTSECSGVLYDSGGSNGNYSDDEDQTFTICPGVLNQCIEFNIEYYNIENGIDFLTFYDGDNTDAPIITQISGFDINGISGGGGVCYTLYATKCLTVQLTSDGETNAEGFKASWQCSNKVCKLPETVKVDTAINETKLNNTLSSSLVDIKVTNVDCSQGAIGIFSDGDKTNLGIDNGLLITSGQSILVQGPNLLPDAGFSHDKDGDPDLDTLSALLGSNLLSNDACVIEMEAFVNSNELNFEFLFGSEEYPEFANSDFNDIFALFIEGPGIDGIPELGGKKNLAVLPNTETFIEINNVNPANNWEYYRNNQLGLSSEYDGLVVDYLGSNKSITATSPVVPCNTYKLKFAVADRFDYIYDSGVFISELTNSVPEIKLTSSYGFDYLLEKCSDGQDLIVVQLASPQEETLKFAPTISGTAVNGEDYMLELPDTIVFEPGQTLITFPITVLSDDITEGTETINILFQNDFGCGVIDITEIEIEIREELDVQAQGGMDTVYVCKGLPIELFADGATAFTWSPADELNDASIVNPTFIDPQVPTVFTVTGTIPPFTDPACMGTDQVTVIPIAPELEIIPNDPTEICLGDTINVTLQNNTEGQGISWAVPNNGVLSTSTETTDIVPPFFDTDGITYTAFLSLNGCADTATIDIVVDPFTFPEILVAKDSIVCEGYDILLAEGGGFFTQYVWTPSDNLDNDSIASATATIVEDVTYKLVATSPNAVCADSVKIDIIMQENSIEILGQDSIFLCLGDSMLVSSTGTSNGTGISWLPAEKVDNPDTASVYVYPDFSEYYYVNMDFNGCMATDSIWVQVDSLPSMEFEVIQDKPMYCKGEVITIVSPGYNPADFPNIESMWEPAAGIVSELDNWNLAIIAEDTATFRRISVNGACLDTIERELFVLDPVAEIMLSDTSALCPFTPVDLLLTSDSEIEDIMWDPGMPDLSCDDCEDPTATVGSTTTFVASMQADGCPVTAMATVKIQNQFVNINFDQQNVCPGTEVQASLTGSGAFTNIQWSPASAVSCTDCPNPIVTVNETANISVTATVNGCEVNGSAILNIDNSVRSVNISTSVDPAREIGVGGEVTLTVDPQASFGSNTVYDWFYDNNSIGSGDGNGKITTTQNDSGFVDYKVQIVDDNGCLWEGTVKILGLEPEFKLPNAFTPFNSDDVNKTFRLLQIPEGGLGNWQLDYFNIYDRWGNNVFSCEDKQCALQQGWDGKINEREAPMATYIYAIRITLDNGDKREFRGDVTLLR